jgi:hypothetical protein
MRHTIVWNFFRVFGSIVQLQLGLHISRNQWNCARKIAPLENFPAFVRKAVELRGRAKQNNWRSMSWRMDDHSPWSRSSHVNIIWFECAVVGWKGQWIWRFWASNLIRMYIEFDKLKRKPLPSLLVFVNTLICGVVNDNKSRWDSPWRIGQDFSLQLSLQQCKHQIFDCFAWPQLEDTPQSSSDVISSDYSHTQGLRACEGNEFMHEQSMYFDVVSVECL